MCIIFSLFIMYDIRIIMLIIIIIKRRRKRIKTRTFHYTIIYLIYYPIRTIDYNKE